MASWPEARAAHDSKLNQLYLLSLKCNNEKDSLIAVLKLSHELPQSED